MVVGYVVPTFGPLILIDAVCFLPSLSFGRSVAAISLVPILIIRRPLLVYVRTVSEYSLCINVYVLYVGLPPYVRTYNTYVLRIINYYYGS